MGSYGVYVRSFHSLHVNGSIVRWCRTHNYARSYYSASNYHKCLLSNLRLVSLTKYNSLKTELIIIVILLLLMLPVSVSKLFYLDVKNSRISNQETLMVEADKLVTNHWVFITENLDSPSSMFIVKELFVKTYSFGYLNVSKIFRWN